MSVQERMVPCTILLPPALHAALDYLHSAAGLTRAEVMRTGMQVEIAHRLHELLISKLGRMGYDLDSARVAYEHPDPSLPRVLLSEVKEARGSLEKTKALVDRIMVREIVV